MGGRRAAEGKPSVPQTVRAAIHDRLALLDARTREVLEVAAVLGREVAPTMLAERARTNVQRRIKDAIQRIEKNDPELGRYLATTIRTGTFCMFDPARSPNFE
jgi:hypothetical protein